MRFFATASLCVGVLLTAAACDPTDTKHYFTQGVGTQLYPDDIAAQTDLQNTYVQYVCSQAGLTPSVSPAGVVSCGTDPQSEETWYLFVQAGMNDIDERCDSYLTWLDNVRRARAPTIKELSDAHTAAELIMQATGVGAGPIAVVGAAFGFATDTFTNVTSRLVLEVNHSTVQSVVLASQKQFREDLLGSAKGAPTVLIPSKPAAIYALRSYLRLCMPMTIETQINNTVSVFERAGPDALKSEPMISAKTAGAPFQPQQKIVNPNRPKPSPGQTKADYKKIIKNYDPNVHTVSKVERVLSKLCIPPKTPITPKVNMAIEVFQQTKKNQITGLLNDAEFDLLANAAVCKPNGARNYFEKTSLPKGVASDDLVKDMNLVLDKDHQLPVPSKPADVRNRIGMVRDALKDQLFFKSDQLPDQFSPDLFNALVKKGLFANPPGAAPAAPAAPTAPAAPPSSEPPPPATIIEPK